MRRASAVLLVMVALHPAGCSVRRGADTRARPAERTEWELPPSLILDAKSIDISDDRKVAVAWGARIVESEAKCSCWLIDLHTGKTTDLQTLVDGAAAAPILSPGYAQVSPDGKHVLITAGDGLSACVVNPTTGKSIHIARPDRFRMMWAGNRLLLSQEWKSEAPEILDVTGQHLGTLPFRGQLLASDTTGTKLLAIVNADDPSQQVADWWDGTVAVVTPKGKIHRTVAPCRGMCDRDWPLFSPAGNWAGLFCRDKDGWAYSLVSTTTDEVFRLRRPWGSTLLLTDAGDSIFMAGGRNTTFSTIMRGGTVDDVEGRDIVFWPRDDDPWKSTEGAPAEPSFNDMIWNRMPKGQSLVLAGRAIAVAVLRDELFLVQETGDERTLRAIPLPKPGTTSDGTSRAQPSRSTDAAGAGAADVDGTE